MPAASARMGSWMSRTSRVMRLMISKAAFIARSTSPWRSGRERGGEKAGGKTAA